MIKELIQSYGDSTWKHKEKKLDFLTKVSKSKLDRCFKECNKNEDLLVNPGLLRPERPQTALLSPKLNRSNRAFKLKTGDLRQQIVSDHQGRNDLNLIGK